MTVGRRRGNFNLGNWLFVAGLLTLILTFWVPLASASRTARAEERADFVAEILLTEALAMQPLDLADPIQTAVLFARTLRSCAAAGVHIGDLEVVTAPGSATPMLWLESKHYLFQLAGTPVDPVQQEPPSGLPALEVLAWPSEGSPGHAAFYHAELGDAAYTRNLETAYAGTDLRPGPGAGQRRPDPVFERPLDYRGMDDERWLVLVRPPPGAALRSTPTGNR